MSRDKEVYYDVLARLYIRLEMPESKSPEDAINDFIESEAFDLLRSALTRITVEQVSVRTLPNTKSK